MIIKTLDGNILIFVSISLERGKNHGTRDNGLFKEEGGLGGVCPHFSSAVYCLASLGSHRCVG